MQLSFYYGFAGRDGNIAGKGVVTGMIYNGRL
jgi:hypothetical protein